MILNVEIWLQAGGSALLLDRSTLISVSVRTEPRFI